MDVFTNPSKAGSVDGREESSCCGQAQQIDVADYSSVCCSGLWRGISAFSTRSRYRSPTACNTAFSVFVRHSRWFTKPGEEKRGGETVANKTTGSDDGV